MPINIPGHRQIVRAPQISARKIPVREIIEIEGQNPVATGIEVAGNVIGQAIQRRAELRREGEQLAQMTKMAGLDEGSLSNFSPSQGFDLTAPIIREKMQRNQGVMQEGFYSPSQVSAISPDLGKTLPLAFPNGVPKEAVTSALSAQRTNLTEDERNNRQEERLSRQMIAYSESLEKNPVLRELNKQQIGVDQVQDLIDIVSTGNTVAASAMGTKMARAMGEVGVLTESDIKRYVQSGRLDRSAADTLSRMMTGRPTRATLGEIRQISDVLENSYQSKVQPIYNKYVERLSRNAGIPLDEASYRLAVPYNPSIQKKSLKQKELNQITPKKFNVGGFTVEVEE